MSTLHSLKKQQVESSEKTWLALTLLVVEVVIFFGFIAIGAFSPKILATPLMVDGTTTVAFLYGIVILVVSVLLTGLYVAVENGSDRS